MTGKKRVSTKKIVPLVILILAFLIPLVYAYKITIRFYDSANENSCKYDVISPNLTETANPSFSSLFNESKLCCGIPREGYKSYSARAWDDQTDGPGRANLSNVVSVSYDGSKKTCECRGYNWSQSTCNPPLQTFDYTIYAQAKDKCADSIEKTTTSSTIVNMTIKANSTLYYYKSFWGIWGAEGNTPVKKGDFVKIDYFGSKYRLFINLEWMFVNSYPLKANYSTNSIITKTTTKTASINQSQGVVDLGSISDAIPTSACLVTPINFTLIDNSEGVITYFTNSSGSNLGSYTTDPLARVAGLSKVDGSCCCIGDDANDASCLPTPPSSCPANQTIMRISATTNALGEVWNGTSNYSVSICYPDIFGVNYTFNPGVNPHACITGENANTVLKLNATTNAHAEKPTLNNYQTNVCYGNLNCISSTSSCPPGYNETVRLSTDTNAYLETSSGTGNYPVKICCKNTEALPTTNAYWAEHMTGRQITETQVNDTVSLVWNINVANGTSVNFTIHERDISLLDSDCFGDGIKLQATVSGGKAIATWTAKLCNNGKSDGVYFDALVTNNPSTKDTSNNLTISKPENNAEPVAIISTPQEGKWYPVTVPLFFGQASYDVDDNIVEYKWNFGDGNITTLIGTSSGNLTHSYLTGGPMNIDLTVKSGVSGRAKTSSYKIVIGIDTPGNDAPCAIISSPKDREHFKGGSVSVLFNATSTSDNETAFGNLIFNWIFDNNPNNPLNHVGTGIAGAYFSQLFPVGEHTLRLIVDDGDASA